MQEYLITNATLLSGKQVDIEIEDGKISAITAPGTSDRNAYDTDRRFDANGSLVTPPLTEPHIHLDATLTAGNPTWNRSGTLAEGIDIWADRKASLSKSDVKSRAYQTIKWLVTHGVTHIRTHVDTTEKTLTGLQGLLELREELPNTIELQIVAFPQDGIFTDEDHEDLFREAINMGVDVVGGIPHNEYTYEDGIRDVKLAVELADANNLPVDLHIDETDDPQSRFTEVLANEARKHGIGARTTASHATAMHSYSDAYADKLLSLIAESNISVITNPPDNSVLQGRYDSYPRRRGHTRIDQLHDNDVTVGLGHDSVMDPWYHYGQGDPLDAAFILIHYAHMSGRDDVQIIWKMLTEANASILNIDQHELKEGTSASLVVYDSPDPFNALRTQADRLLVMQNGEILAKTQPSESTIFLDETEESVTFHRDREMDF